MNWIELIRALTPIIIALVQPHLKGVAEMTTTAMVHAEQTGKNGPDKLDDVLKDMLPIAAKDNPHMKVDDVKESLTKGIDTSIAVANLIKQIHNFNHGI